MRIAFPPALVAIAGAAAFMLACRGGEAKVPPSPSALPGPLNAPPAVAEAPAPGPEGAPAVEQPSDGGEAHEEPAPVPEPPLAEYAPATHDTPEDVVPSPLTRYLTKRLNDCGASSLSTVWGKRVEELPFLAGVAPEEVEDTRPWQTLFVHRTGVGEGWRQLKATWGFLDGELFMVRLDYRDRGKRLPAKTEGVYGATPVNTSVLRDGEVLRTWHDNGLVVGVAEHKRRHALLLAERGRYERYLGRLGKVDEAEHLVWGTLELFYDPKTMDISRALEGNLEAAKLVAGFGDAWSNACHAAYQLGRLNDAQEYCTKALDVTGEQSVRGEATYYKGLIAIARGQKAEGLRLLRLAKTAVPRRWGISSDIQVRIAGLEGKPNDETLERAVYDYWCSGYRDGTRQQYIPAEYGFSDYEALRTAADDELVDIEGAKERAEQNCARR